MAESCDLACTPSKNLHIEVLTFSHIGLLKDLRKSWGVFGFKQSAPHISPPYKAIGFINWSNSLSAAGAFMSDPADVLFSLNRARIDLSDKLAWAVHAIGLSQ